MTRELHGLTRGGKPPEYFLWHQIIQRCENPRHPRYSDYGGRGIAVCKRWRDSFSAFLMDVGKRPQQGLTLDRVDNSKGYEPGNVRWATATQQSQNRRNIIKVSTDDGDVCLKEYCRRKGLSYGTISSRINKYGWSLNEAIRPGNISKHAAKRTIPRESKKMGAGG